MNYLKIYLEITYNFGILISMCIISGFITLKIQESKLNSILQGTLFGIAAIIGMANPVVVTPGLIFDGRSVMISSAGIFFGPAAATISGLFAVVLRIAQGGLGAKTGVLVIVWSALIGVVFHYIYKKRNLIGNILFCYIAGLVVHIGMALLMATLPGAMAFETLTKLGPYIVLIYPIVSLIVGAVLSEINKTIETNKYLKIKEEQIVNISKSFTSGMIYQIIAFSNGDKKFTYISDSVIGIFGVRVEDVLKDAVLLYKNVVEEDLVKLIEIERISFINVSPIRAEIRINNLEGNIRWASISSTPKIMNDGSIRYDGIAYDVTDLKRAEESIRESLLEKEALIRELYHRTKNNMTIISSYLQLQATYAKNEEFSKMVKDSIARIRAMSLVHEKLYDSKNLSRINMKEYITDLVNQIASYYNIQNKVVKYNYFIEDISLSIDTAIPVGMVINEIAVNSFKYAFNNKESCEIRISMTKSNDNTIFLTIADNGIGLAEGFDAQRSNTLGIPTLYSIVEMQLRGKISYENKDGLSYSVSFKDILYKKRLNS